MKTKSFCQFFVIECLKRIDIEINDDDIRDVQI